ncbi:PaaX family transcriptional regulator C-terminal domain-containing protein [Microbacterium sp. SSM24]|uniref:PaaX family transcriptional regulator n=1 Tax=Microbacterium sp. SSM24 TaxID=2991714 RepID=UPI002226D1DD|nr:PaaX family transcriptional regulator C-terminal domain-containing protein [Microbacterium sp. SSM24]MCW3492675.1 phenylacetic acid-responsive transcriptional repressor [Microbacterium sp. SSM24]
MLMKPRALILDIFGDYLRYVDSEVKAGDLVTLLGVLGVEPAATRMTLSRLKQEGWFTTRKVGRETIYRLSDHLLEILDEGRSRIFAEYEEDWDGWWTQVVFQTPESDRTVREQVKKQLAWLGFGPLTPSTWLSPRNAKADALKLQAEFATATIDVLASRTDDPARDRALVARCWDLSLLETDYREFIEGHRDLLQSAPTLEGPSALAVRTEIVSTYRHFPFRDPSLPVALRPDGWSGAEAHDLFLAVHRALAGAAVAYVSEVVGMAVETTELRTQNM